jgi:hypothetical protein
VTPSATARLHTTTTHAVPSTTETPEHHFAAVTNTINPEDGRIHPKRVESYNTCNKAIHCCIKLDTHLPYDVMHGHTNLKFYISRTFQNWPSVCPKTKHFDT